MTDVKLFTTPSCPYCNKIKKFFDEKEIEYSEFNVAENKERAEEMVKKSGQRGVPVTLVENDEEEIIVGFDKEKLRKVLDIQ